MNADAYAALERLAAEHERLAAEIRATVRRSRALLEGAEAPGELAISEAVKAALRDGPKTAAAVRRFIADAGVPVRSRSRDLGGLVSVTLSMLKRAGDVRRAGHTWSLAR